MHRFASATFAAIAVLVTGCQTAAPPVTGTDASLEWEPVQFLSGCWRAENGDRASLEVWTKPHGDAMHGQNHSLRSGRLTFFELLTIERRGGGLVYVARPRGSAPTEFAMTAHEAGSVTFENAEHDFPKRIHYKLLSTGELTAVVDGGADAGDGKKLEFRWQPVR